MLLCIFQVHVFKSVLSYGKFTWVDKLLSLVEGGIFQFHYKMVTLSIMILMYETKIKRTQRYKNISQNHTR